MVFIANSRRSFPAVSLTALRSLSRRTFIQALFGQECRDVVDMDAVTHTSVLVRRLHNRDVSVAIIVARCRAMQDSECFDFPTVKADDFVSVFCFSSVSVVHGFIRPFWPKCWAVGMSPCERHRAPVKRDGELDAGRTVATFRLKEHDVDGRSILRRRRGRFRRVDEPHAVRVLLDGP